MNNCTKLACLALLTAAPALADTVLVPIPPRSCFLRTNQDSPTAPVIRSLASLGIAPGDRIRIHVVGEIVYNTGGSITRSSNAVFSSSSTLLATNIQQRVPNAIAAGESFVSGATYYGGLVTDIPQDFRIGDAAGSLDAEVVVPMGAAYLFMGVADSLYNDNTDTDNDFGAEVTLVCAGNHCCGHADYNCDGDIGTDADIEAFFACLSGNCPAAPCTSTADFNGDGDTGTDADIEAFFRVLGGGAC